MAFTEQLAEIDLFSAMSKRELKRAASLITTVPVKARQALTEEGKPGREFMFVSEGCATVSRAGRGLARLGPGDFFGELSLISGRPRVATVTADTDMVVNSLNRREFATLLDQSPSVAKKILTGAVDRLYQLDEYQIDKRLDFAKSAR